jgi:CDP-diacylglycerol---serine O-phosphatidyltransferase
MKQLPNIFTLLNLICGCIAIVYTLQNGITIQYTADNAQFINMPEKIWMASLFIGIAAVVDFLDGFVARLFNASSEMGKQLDSLADVVSFGAAPSMIIYQFLRMAYAQTEGGIDVSSAWLFPAFIIAAAGAYRLARFNIDTEQQYGFKGVPINLLQNKWFLYAVILVVSGLMISRLPLMALKFKDVSVKNNLSKYLLIFISVVAAIFLQWLAVPVIFILYIILSLAFKNKSA